MPKIHLPGVVPKREIDTTSNGIQNKSNNTPSKIRSLIMNVIWLNKSGLIEFMRGLKKKKPHNPRIFKSTNRAKYLLQGWCNPKTTFFHLG